NSKDVYWMRERITLIHGNLSRSLRHTECEFRKRIERLSTWQGPNLKRWQRHEHQARRQGAARGEHPVASAGLMAKRPPDRHGQANASDGEQGNHEQTQQRSEQRGGSLLIAFELEPRRATACLCQFFLFGQYVFLQTGGPEVGGKARS